jgi:exodeoxyribonuclease VII small subunit
MNSDAGFINCPLSTVLRGAIVSTVPKPNLSYEEAYKRLEEAVTELSAGGLSLEEALQRFEQGMALANYCSAMLDRAELRVQQVGQLAPEELDALIDGAPGTQAGPTAGAAARNPLAGPGPGTTGRGTLAGPAPGGPTATGRGPLTGPAPGSRRGLPPTTGPQRKPSADEPLDPLFDDI